MLTLEAYRIPDTKPSRVESSRVEVLADRVHALSAALAIVTGWLILSLAGNVLQSCNPSYSNADRAALTALIDQLPSRQ